MIEQLSAKIEQMNQAIQCAGEEQYKETARIRQVTGVGPLTALAFVLIPEDPWRFKSSRTVGAFVGLTPKESRSGRQEPQLRITRAGDHLLRSLLMGSAQYILGPFGPDSDVQRHGEAIALARYAKAIWSWWRKLATIVQMS